jgi:hypothetical protein
MEIEFNRLSYGVTESHCNACDKHDICHRRLDMERLTVLMPYKVTFDCPDYREASQ